MFKKVNKGQRIIVIEHDSVKKYISQRKKQVSYFQTKPTEVIENSDINPRLTIKQRLRTEILGRPSYNQLDMEMEQFSWQKNLTIAEKKNLLNNLAKNYQKFKKITDKSVENNRNFMPNIKRPAFSAKNHAKMISFNPGKEKLNKEERAKTCAVYEKGENRIKRIFEGRGDDEITNKENTNNNERRNIKKLEKEVVC